MDLIIKNESLTVTVSSKGGQLMSVLSSEGIEYIWQGDPTYWVNRAPLLFPYVGRFTDGKYIMDGSEHEMVIHGFFRNRECSIDRHTETCLTLSQHEDEETLSSYDRSFNASVTYELTGNTLKISFNVINTDTRPMYFGYGGHPGFNVPLTPGIPFEDHYLEFGSTCEAVQVGMSPTGYVSFPDLPLPLTKGRILPLKHELFNNDAIVLRNVADSVSIKSQKSPHYVTVTYPQMPYLGIWHKPNSDAPYVCIEPWVSLPSRQGIIEEFEAKHDLIILAPGKEYNNTFTIDYK